MAEGARPRAALRRAADPRVIGGIVVMAASAYGGVTLLDAGQDSALVAVAVRDLPAGIELQDGDFILQRVVVARPERYVDASTELGALVRPVGEGELIPLAAVADERPDSRMVAVPVDLERLPPGLDRGARVDVWAVGATSPELVGASVMSVTDPEQWAGATATVVLAVGPGDVPGLLAAARSGAVDLTGYGSAP
jgi:hypothetical protein